MRKLASVQKIIDIRPIEGADRIVVANVLGWECVIRKDEFKVGDLIVYIEVDSKVPNDNPKFEFLKDISKALDYVVMICILYKINKLAMPIIGCGLDKLKWVDVKALILNKFKNTDIDIVVCKK